MDKQGILSRVLKKLPLEHAMEIIQEKHPGWTPAKKPKKKDDIKGEFLSLASVIRDEEIEDFVQMAVMKKSVGLPAYTYKMTDTDVFKDTNLEELQQNYEVNNHSFRDKYTISTQMVSFGEKLEINFRVKEYESSWKTGVNNVDSLSAVYTAKVTIDITDKVVTVFSGNHEVQEVITDFMQHVFGWPLNSYRIIENSSQVLDLGSVNYTTAILLDFIQHRLSERGIISTFKEIKFFTGAKRRKDGIRDVAIGGRALLSSQLACEYITTGTHVIYFKVDMILNDVEFSTKVYLKGTKNDMLKIVLLDTDDHDLRHRAMEIIQEEYIKMCQSGIKDMQSTKTLLSSIADRYFKKDQLITRAIQENTLKSIESISALLTKFDDQDSDIILSLKEFVKANQTILDSIGYDDNVINLRSIAEFSGIDADDMYDVDDYESSEDDDDDEREDE